MRPSILRAKCALPLPATSGAQQQEGTLYVILVPEADPAWDKVIQLERDLGNAEDLTPD